ncbi:MAG: hypothetical protein ACI4KR_00420 [Ruminiclostridium sp.]
MGRKKLSRPVPKKIGVRSWLINVSESRWKSPPTEEDIVETYDLLNDFGLSRIKVPEFATYGELERWRKEKCKNACI